MNNERQIAKQKFDEHFMFKDNPIAWTAWKMAFQLGIEHQRALQQADVVRSLPLVEALEQYIGVLGEELDELASVAVARGWKSSRVEIGEQLRNRIAELKRQ